MVELSTTKKSKLKMKIESDAFKLKSMWFSQFGKQFINNA